MSRAQGDPPTSTISKKGGEHPAERSNSIFLVLGVGGRSLQLRICQTERISLTNVASFITLTKPAQALL